RAWLCMLAIGLGCGFIADTAAGSEEPVKYHLRIASQPLDSALQEFAHESGLQVIYFSGVTAGMRAPALVGHYTLQAAMRALLADTGLTWHVINSKTVEIRQVATQPRDPQAVDPQSVELGHTKVSLQCVANPAIIAGVDYTVGALLLAPHYKHTGKVVV